MGGETENLPTRRRTNSGLVGSSVVISPNLEDLTHYTPTLVRCRYYYVGCHEMIESCGYLQHLEDYQREHMRQLEATVAIQSQKISQLEAAQAYAAAAAQSWLDAASASASASANASVSASVEPPRPPVESARVLAPQPLTAKELLDAIADLLEKQVAALFSSTREFLAPKSDDLDTPGLKTWQILHLFVLSFIVLCYLSLAGMGRLWAVMQVVPLLAYCSLMSLHWQNALLFSSTANTMISLGVVFLWGSISLFLPVF